VQPSAKEPLPIYEFGEFRLDVGERLLLRDGEAVVLQPKAFELLVALVSRAGALLKTDQLLDAVWPDANVEPNNLHVNISLLRTALGDDANDPSYIKTVRKGGYRFVAEVREIWPEPPLPELRPVAALRAIEAPAPVPPDTTADPVLPPSWYGAHAAFACGLYALLYVVALFVEVAYQFERLGSLAWRFGPWVFVWIAATSGLALWVDWGLTRSGRATGLACSIPLFVVAGFAVAGALGPFLPAEPVTGASFNTYSAQAAYLKSCYYFVPLAVIYLVIPFHTAVALDEEAAAGNAKGVARLLRGVRSGRAPRGSIYLRVWWLAVLLTVASAGALYGTAHLFERLTPNTNRNFFMLSLQARVLLYFLLGCECMLWYHLTLNDVRHRVANRETPS
jgi:DNA-binding winged helix-turn-helix (wHTH) protein